MLTESPAHRIEPYRREHGPEVAAWVRSIEEALAWAALDGLPSLGDLARWHAEPDVVPFVFFEAEELVGYGEIWEDREADEAELARLVVRPGSRGRGLGRAMTRALANEARERGFAAVWLRVVPGNRAAIRAYEASGFVRATTDEEAAFNAGQPRPYVWLRDSTTT